MNGLDFNATLRSLYSVDDNLDKLNLTSITTLVAQSAMDNNTPSIAKREQSLQQMVNMGMLKKEDWFERDPSFVNMNKLDAWQENELDVWVNAILVDVDDSQLEKDKMRIFTMAHGGVERISAYPNDFISIFPGQEKEIAVFLDFVDTNNTPIVIRKVSGADWISIQDNSLVITPDTALTSYGDFSIELEVLVNNIPIGRSKTIIVSLVKKITLLSGELGIQGGKIENQWKDISISVDADKLSQTYEIEYNAGLTKDGKILFEIVSSPEMNKSQISQLNFIEPSQELLKNNYLINTENSLQSRGLRNTNTYKYSILSSNGVPSECMPGSVNGYINEMVWTSGKTDKISFPYVWQGESGIFEFVDGTIEDTIGDTGGMPRIQKGKKVSLPFSLCANALRSEVSDNTDISDKEAVLFVHGFIASGKLGGYDQNNNAKPGIGFLWTGDANTYFSRFPHIVEDYTDNGNKSYIPFIFQWRTNAKFEDVASELGRAVEEIAKKNWEKGSYCSTLFWWTFSKNIDSGFKY